MKKNRRPILPQALVKRKNQSAKRGLPPGSIVHIGSRRQEQVILKCLRWSQAFQEESVISLPLADPGDQGNRWFQVSGLHDERILEQLGKTFGISNLVLEDVANTSHRPKFEFHSEHLFLTFKSVSWDEARMEVGTDQVSMILSSDWLLSFQEGSDEGLVPIKTRMADPSGRLRRSGPDYLAYALMDSLVDNYFPVVEQLQDLFEDLEDRILVNPEPHVPGLLHHLRRQVSSLRRVINPLRDMIQAMDRDESGLLKRETRLFLRDTQDHVVQLVELIDGLRDHLVSLLELHVSLVSNRMNEVMRVLTVIATLFIPLTFIAGIYGMNFDLMPELHWKYGYPVVLLVMLLASLGMLVYFRKKRWM